MKGTVATTPLEEDLVSGMPCALLHNDNESTVSFCTLSHLNTDCEWVVEGDLYSGRVLPQMRLCKLIIIENKTGTCYPLNMNDWSKVSKLGVVNTLKQLEFKLTYQKFYPGKYYNVCFTCNNEFLAYKGQSFCKPCCEKMATAKLAVSKNNKPVKVKEPVKKKRSRVVTKSKAITVAIASYNKGIDKLSLTEFKEWLTKQF